MKKIILTFALATFLFSCEDYIDVNESQSNNPSANIINPALTLAGAINNFTSNQVVSFNSFGNEMAYIWALNSGFTSASSRITYNFTSSDEAGLFETTYLNADNFQDILDSKANFPDYSYHFAIAKLFKVMSMDLLVTTYGDVPYSQAFKSNVTRPKYDDDAAIIPALFAELDEAREYINNPSANVVPLGNEDIVFNGDTSKWLKLINTIELRMLLRLSNTTNASLITLRNARFASLSIDFVDENVTCNPGYGIATLGQRNPIFRTWGLNAALDAWSSQNRANAAGSFCAKLLLGQLNTPTVVNTGLADPRRPRIFSGTTYTNIGTFPTAEVARVASFFIGRVGSGADVANNAASNRDAYLMLAAESHFLQAEAMERGYMAGGSGAAKIAFEQGINASFDFYNDYSFTDLPNGTLNAATYITSSNSKLGLGWAASPNKISCIIHQKYIALAQWNGYEVYIDHLRTGFPVLPLPDGINSVTNRPKRMIYPSSEYSTNATNVPTVRLDEIFNVNDKTPVYLQ
jgi:hypothetical protein